MKFRFYSAAFVKEDGKTGSISATTELPNLEEATKWMRSGTMTADDIGWSFIPVVCEQIDEVVK